MDTDKEELLISINEELSQHAFKAFADSMRRLIFAANDLGLKGATVTRIDSKRRTDTINRVEKPATDVSYELWGKRGDHEKRS